VSLGIGVIAGSGTAFVVHIVPFGMERTLSLQSASALLSIYSGCGILGTLIMGWVADRIGPPAALMIAAASMSMLWWVLLQVSGIPLYLVAALVGVFGVPIVTLHGAALSSMFGVNTLSRAMGLSYSIKLPFIFSFAPVVGLLFGRTGSYRLPFLIIAASLALAAVCFYLTRVIVHGRQGPAEAAATQ
jgi:MFS family permease